MTEATAFANTWNPAEVTDQVAPEGWIFPGFMAFVCFGPSSPNFSAILRRGGSRSAQDSKEAKKNGSRSAMLAEKRERDDKTRKLEPHRGVSEQTMHVMAFRDKQLKATNDLRTIEVELMALSTAAQSEKDMFDRYEKILPLLGDGPAKDARVQDMISCLDKMSYLNKQILELRESAKEFRGGGKDVMSNVESTTIETTRTTTDHDDGVES